MAIGHFLGGIGALVYDSATNRYLFLRRSSWRDYGAGNWECVTGRLEQGEGYEEALHREVREEIDITVQIEFIVGTTHFYRGVPEPENELIGVVYCCSTQEADRVQIGVEHSEYHWMSAEEAYAELDPDRWLYQVVERAEMIHKLAPPALRQYYRQQGFETG